MSIDIAQFHQVFFEESFEGLEVMESGLIDLEIGRPDSEAINAIFRAAHSIKGGSGTFGFTAISDFTHVLETLLDEMRNGTRDVTREAVDVLLLAVDSLREMLSAARDGSDFDAAAVAEVHDRLEELLKLGHGESTAVDAADATAPAAAAPASTGAWLIRFVPHPHLFTTGNDPVRILRELCALGEAQVQADCSRLPDYAEFDAETCYLAWTINLDGNVEESAVREVFEWIEDDADISLIREHDEEDVAVTAAPVADATTAQDAPALQVAPPVDDRRSGDDRREGEDRRGGDRRAAGGSASGTSSIRVDIGKIDTLINLVGELVITQSMLGNFDEDSGQIDYDKLREGLAQLERNTRELQESVMRIRMLPISFSFNRFPRLVRDLSSKLGKQVELKIVGEQTELDKTVLEKIADPLVHLVRNSLDHGIEPPADRIAAGKSAHGTVTLAARHEGGNIVIEIGDDGAGLNPEKLLAKARERGLVGAEEILPEDKIHELIFHPGFSTAKEVSDVSGRGVGMDVVKRNIKELGGVIELDSKFGHGSTIRIRLPLTLAILDGQLVRVGGQTYIVPLVSIVESLQAQSDRVKSVAASAELYRLRGEYIPIVRLYEVFGVEPQSRVLEQGLLVVVEGEGQRAGIFVDELLGQQQVVIKSLETNYRRVEGISGATILGDGTVAMILDAGGLIALHRHPASPKAAHTNQAA
ncbi:MAG: chemotaxis protein CheA [Gammaproteobacteria bacterium]|nr:chemotaxis protein CheA [Gammaproteobacteria bacterium]MCP5199183.1 chemotaxis protein CheA [Gammaproteobacteria bacterium]